MGAAALIVTDPADFVPVESNTVAFVEAGYAVAVQPRLGPTPAQSPERVRPFVEMGVRHFQIIFEDQHTIDRFCVEVAPR